MRDGLERVQASQLGKCVHRLFGVRKVIQPRGIRLANRKNQCLYLLHLHRMRYYTTYDAKERAHLAYSKTSQVG